MSALGLGAGPLGDAALSDVQAGRIVHAALDLGVTLIDTARSYGASEERIGRALVARRERAVLSTKVGYGIEGVEDWTGEAVRRGIEEALRKLRTEWIDVVHLHSCPVETLRRGEVTEALAEAVRAGKVRVASYSGENEALDWAVASGLFGAVEMSVSPWDQGAIDRTLWRAKERGLGVIAKRALGNAWWRFEERPSAPDVAEYWERGRAMGAIEGEMGRGEMSVRFAAFTWGVDSAIVGTTRTEHLAELAQAVGKGRLPEDAVRRVRAGFRARGAGWRGVI
ncbi:MAG: aldo/keto reductase [Polyangiaceae bacterium]